MKAQLDARTQRVPRLLGHGLRFAGGKKPLGALLQLACWGLLSMITQTAASAGLPSQKFPLPQAPYPDMLGYSIALSGDRAIVGAPGGTFAPTSAGAAYVYVRGDDGWSGEQELLAADGQVADRLGWAVDMRGDIAVVGADQRAGTGAAYVFRRVASGWQQDALLTAPGAAAQDYFGSAVATDGDRIVVGAYGVDGVEYEEGAAFVYVWDGSSWSFEQKLALPLAAERRVIEGTWLGFSVAIDGDTIVAGADGDDEGGDDAGAAYVFTLQSGVWTLQQKLAPSAPYAYRGAGWSVGLHGNLALVSTREGSVYSFVRDSAHWTEEGTLTDSAAGPCGEHVSIHSNRAIIGGCTITVDGASQYPAYVFQREAGAWRAVSKLLSPDSEPYFGAVVDIDDSGIIVGNGDDDVYGISMPTVPIVNGVGAGVALLVTSAGLRARYGNAQGRRRRRTPVNHT
ncbi:MAG: FG-GAP repeat protein [Candidatus Schekmanbacteria bacterium]|nr:FG-GAP repeat protein [Candidatus Schekmanbacteria bacterium]